MTNATTEYSKPATRRIILGANGVYRRQIHVGRNEQRRNVDDGWRDVGKPTDRDEARGWLRQFTVDAAQKNS